LPDPHHFFLHQAIEMAKESVVEGGFPAGAIIVKNGSVIGKGLSVGNKHNDPTSHGDMAAIQAACHHLRSSRLSGCTLYTTMQPCLMCFAASMWGGIEDIYFAIRKEKVSLDYYGERTPLLDINATLVRPIAFHHVPELEEAALVLVQQWERNPRE